ncbi:hypothetical protein D3C78_1435700 [compost metagenome]
MGERLHQQVHGERQRRHPAGIGLLFVEPLLRRAAVAQLVARPHVVIHFIEQVRLGVIEWIAPVRRRHVGDAQHQFGHAVALHIRQRDLTQPIVDHPRRQRQRPHRLEAVAAAVHEDLHLGMLGIEQIDGPAAIDVGEEQLRRIKGAGAVDSL